MRESHLRKSDCGNGRNGSVLCEFFELLPDAVVLVSEAGRIDAVNGRAGAMFGYTCGELVGRNIEILIPERFRETCNIQRMSCAQVPNVRPFGIGLELFGLRKDGTEFPAEISLGPAETSMGLSILCVLRDISARKHEEATRFRHAQIIDQIVNDAIICTDLDRRVTLWNKGAEMLFGYSAEEALGTHASQLYAPDESKAPDLLMPEKLRQRNRLQIEARMRRKTGDTFHARLSLSLLRDTQGLPTGIIGYVSDITNTGWAEEALQESENRFRQIVENIQDVFWMSDVGQTKVLYVNSAYEKVWGRTCQSLYEAPASYLDVIHPDDRDRVKTSFAASPPQHEVVEEFRIVRADGSIRWILDRGFPIRDSFGRAYRLAGVASDITARKLAELELEARVARQQAVAELGAYALQSKDMDELLEETARRLPQISEADLCGVLRFRPDGKTLVLSAGVGWLENCIGQEIVAAAPDSEAAYLLNSSGPVAVVAIEDIHQEKRFSIPGLLERHGVVSSISALVGSRNRPFGILCACTMRKRAFSQHDVNLMRAVANILAATLERRRAEEEIRKLNDDLERRVAERTGQLAVLNRTLESRNRDVERANQKALEEIARRQQGEEFLQKVVETTPTLIVLADSRGKLLLFNSAAERATGYSRNEVLGKRIAEVFQSPEWISDIERWSVDPHAPELRAAHATRLQTKSGEERLIEWLCAPVRVLSLSDPCMLSAGIDITERRKAEEAVRQSQKLESIGVLAGGIAHDFNNLLAGILGFTSMALEMLEEDHMARPMLEHVVQGSERAADLTRQLLAYAGKGRFVIESVNLSRLVREIGSLIHASIPHKVNLKMELQPDLPPIEADIGQIQQLVMNLVINGAEAVGESSGTVRVTTGTEQVGEGDATPGQYVYLEVQDDGVGMDEATRARIFDPFFTTKFLGRGLGLAAVQGIVRGHRGMLQVRTAPGEGSTFKVLLPSSERRSEEAVSTPGKTGLTGSGLILVVDDEEAIRNFAGYALPRFGYTVLVARNGHEAIERFREKSGGISLILLDLKMPVMGGDEALASLRAIRPDVKIILSSGYSEDEALRLFAGKGANAFIQKPYTVQELVEKVNSVLRGNMMSMMVDPHELR